MARESRDLSRRQNIIHPSEMSHSDWCPKATYLRIKRIRDGGEFVKEPFGFQSLNIFQHGHEMHRKWQTWLWEMGELWGLWKCHTGTCDWEWAAVSPEHCPNCLAPRHALTYEEIPLSAEDDLLIQGSADGGVPRLRALLEFKTVGVGTLRVEAPDVLRAHTHKAVNGASLIDYEGLWRSITRPFPAHQKQGQIYLYLCNRMGLEFDRVIYIYESKFNQGTKEFVVKYRPSLIASVLHSAEEIHRALDDGWPPPQCPKGGCKHCQPTEMVETSAQENPDPRRPAERRPAGRPPGRSPGAPPGTPPRRRRP